MGEWTKQTFDYQLYLSVTQLGSQWVLNQEKNLRHLKLNFQSGCLCLHRHLVQKDQPVDPQHQLAAVKCRNFYDQWRHTSHIVYKLKGQISNVECHIHLFQKCSLILKMLTVFFSVQVHDCCSNFLVVSDTSLQPMQHPHFARLSPVILEM